jgi:RNA ligase
MDIDRTIALIEFPKIGQFANVVRNIRQKHKDDLILPIVRYTGKVKSHGTNSSIVFNSDDTFYCQSRSRIITPLSDNAGFAAWASKNIDLIKDKLEIERKFKDIRTPELFADNTYSIVVYGEWCGGSIQSGIALSELSKRFIVFAFRSQIAPEATPTWTFNKLTSCVDESIGLFNTDLFKQYELNIDFNHPHLIQNQLVEYTQEVERECPIGAYFGVKGIGEGLVFSCQESTIEPELYNFKSKGEEHSKSKVITVGVVDLEKIEKIEELVKYLLYHNQLESRPVQAIRCLQEQGHAMDSMQSIKLFIDWIRKDIADENMQEILDSGLEVGSVMSACIKQAKQDYQQHLDKLTFST